MPWVIVAEIIYGWSSSCDEGDFCLVAESPCVSVGAGGEVERSAPVRELNGLIHKSELLCKNPQAAAGIIRK